jgi:tRNA-guanine transglycosylase
MISFDIIKKSTRSLARVGVLKTPHGDVETPTFVPVATRGSIRMLDSAEAATLGSQLYICNTFHLHLTPGEDIVAKAGGLHTYSQLAKPLMTDSGGFQVFSLGFGRDHGMGKILQEETEKTLNPGASASNVKIAEDGVSFHSPINGDKLFLSPEISIGIQEKLGADIMFAFDECPSPLSTRDYMRESIDRTHRWAKRCLDAKKTEQALYGIVQGGAFDDLRAESAAFLGAMDFAGFGIGGEFGYDKLSLERVVATSTQGLPADKPRHILGVGHPDDFEYIARGGGDTFDCIAPTHYARHGTVFTRAGKLDLRKTGLYDDLGPIDPGCTCPTCQTYSKSFVSHLVKAHEPSGAKLATVHNVHFFNQLGRELRQKIKNDEI